MSAGVAASVVVASIVAIRLDETWAQCRELNQQERKESSEFKQQTQNEIAFQSVSIHVRLEVTCVQAREMSVDRVSLRIVASLTVVLSDRLPSNAAWACALLALLLVGVVHCESEGGDVTVDWRQDEEAKAQRGEGAQQSASERALRALNLCRCASSDS